MRHFAYEKPTLQQKDLLLLSMDSTRQQKFGRLIQKELGEQFQREGKNYYGSNFVTITGVRVTPDLSVARVYLSIFKAKKPEEVMTMIRENSYEIRKELGKRIRNQARIIPTLDFFLDDSLDYVDKMETIFKKIHIPPAPEAE